MGIYVQLDVLPQMIDQKDWEEVYFETLNFLQNCELDLVGLQKTTKTICGITESRTLYSRQLEHDMDKPSQRGWRVNGDIDSLRTAESFCFPYWLNENGESYTQGQRNEIINNYKGEVDIVYDLINIHSCEENEYRLNNYKSIFDDKTQGYEYHTAMLAVAMLVEDRFPLYAVAWGNIDVFQAENAQKMIKDTLGKDIKLPLCVDRDQLFERISKFKTGSEILKYFNYIYREDFHLDSGGNLKYFFEHVPAEIVYEWFLERAKGFESASKLGPKGYMIDWLNAEADLKKLIQLFCIDDRGPQFEVLNFAKTLINTWITVPKEKRNAWEIFQKPQGSVSTVYSQLGNALFDVQGLKGRNTKVYIDLDTVIATFEELFPEKATAIIQTINENHQKLESFIEESRFMLEEINEYFQKEAYNKEDTSDFEYVLRITEDDELSEITTLMLKTIAAIVQKTYNSFKEHEEYKKFQEIIESQEYKKIILFITYWTREHSFILSEDAWAWIDAEKNMKLLSILVVLIIYNQTELKFYNLKRAIFEKRFLCQKVAELMQEGVVEEMDSLLEQSQNLF